MLFDGWNLGDTGCCQIFALYFYDLQPFVNYVSSLLLSTMSYTWSLWSRDTCSFPLFQRRKQVQDGEVLAHGCVEPIISAQKQALSSWTPYHSFQQLLFLWLLLTKFCSNLTALPGNTLLFCTSGLFLSQLESCDSLLGNQFPFMFPPSPPVHLLPWAGTTNYRLSWCRAPHFIKHIPFIAWMGSSASCNVLGAWCHKNRREQSYLGILTVWWSHWMAKL